jgi:tetraacyldisaccharide-1-P 4'-kinase
MPKPKDMPISVTERKKAEELIKAKFKNLEHALDHEVEDKKKELNRLWAHRIGLDKLQAKRDALQKEIDQLDTQIDAMTEHNYGGVSCLPKPTGKLREALDALDSAHAQTLDRLKEKKSETLERLWFGLLSSDALTLLAETPTVSQLKSNGLSLLQLPAKKLLGEK